MTVPSWAREAWRDVWPVLLASRLLVLVAGVVAVQVGERGAEGAPREAPLPWLHPFGDGLADALLTPLVRWDAVWYLAIAQDGYEPQDVAGNPGVKPAFWPLYPLLVRAVSVTGDPAAAIVAAHVISLVAFAVALVLLHRLVTIELGARYARPVVLLLALSPFAYFFSAPYTESLFLALSVGCLLAARSERWALAAALGALASLTRNTGVVLLLPLAILYLNGPGRQLWPVQRRPRADALWLCLLAAGPVLFTIYLQLATGQALAWNDAQSAFGRPHLELPVTAVWRGLGAAGDGLGALGGDTLYAAQNIVHLAFLAFGVVALVGVWRRLPVAYTAYAAVALLIPLLAPAAGEPLRSIGRFELVLFPLWMWLGWAAARRRLVVPLAAVSAVGLVWVTAAFALWMPWV